jgi:sugar O-acyltransferase (sialic acid O-acetyltransferase NeuD family)
MTIGIFGISNPYVWNLIDLAAELGRSTVLVANQPVPESLEIPHWIDSHAAQRNHADLHYVCGVVQPRSKQSVLAEGTSLGLDFSGQLVSPRAVVSPTVALNKGAIIRQMSVIDAHVSIGEHVTVSPLVSVGHHTRLGNLCHLANGATINGGCTLADGVFVGAGALVRDGVTIGEWATIGMGAVVVSDVPAGATVLGNPARTQTH